MKQIQLYEKMRDAIAFYRLNAKSQPKIGEVAAHVALSPSRFEHAFAEWVGLPPKRFLSYINKERAKDLLFASQDILGATYKLGLSGPNKLHDLLVSLEAVSPGELRRGNIDIEFGIHPSPFGWCTVGTTPRGLCFLAFIEKYDAHDAMNKLQASWPRANLIRHQLNTAAIVNKIFQHKQSSSPIKLIVQGTNFQVKVWEALIKIPVGQVATYGAIAKAVKAPNAARAVGSACGHNPICFLIPCHRVISTNGSLGGYTGGKDRKDSMLEWEHAGLSKPRS